MLIQIDYKLEHLKVEENNYINENKRKNIFFYLLINKHFPFEIQREYKCTFKSTKGHLNILFESNTN
jgi:hypothetical protein